MSTSERPNLLRPEFLQNPYPLYAQLRRTAPVCQVEPKGIWAITRYDDVQYVLKNPQLFSSAGLKAGAEPLWLGRRHPLNDSLVMQDPPAHGRLRALVAKAFGGSMLPRMEPDIRATCERLTTNLLASRPVDFVKEFSIPLPASVIGGMMGLDPALHSRFKQWSDNIIGVSTIKPSDTEAMERSRRTLSDMEQYFQEVLEQRRRQPGDDMVSDLLRARVDGESLTNAELMGFLFMLLVAGLETTANLLSNAARLLAESPETLAKLRADRSLIPGFIEEVMRCEAPVQMSMRLCVQDAEVAGVRLPKGSLVYVVLGSALRDEQRFPDAERFDMTRKSNDSLPFGHGIHFCLGAQLARLEARTALEVLLTRISGWTLRTERLEWVPSIVMRGLKTLPLELTAAP
jgi:cytochrome P450